jgi:hypothetical protein
VTQTRRAETMGTMTTMRIDVDGTVYQKTTEENETGTSQNLFLCLHTFLLLRKRTRQSRYAPQCLHNLSLGESLHTPFSPVEKLTRRSTCEVFLMSQNALFAKALRGHAIYTVKTRFSLDIKGPSRKKRVLAHKEHLIDMW